MLLASKASRANQRTIPRRVSPESRSSRLGGAILTVTVINWALASHDLNGLSLLTGNGALVGMERFGRPMPYAIFAAVLARQVHPAPKERPVQT